jgi:hypothetical protein
MALLSLKHKKFWTLCLLGLAIVTTTFLAAGISRLEFLPGDYFPLGRLFQLLSRRRLGGDLSFSLDIMRPLIACLWLMLVISIIAFIISPEIRREAIKRFIRYLIYALVIYGLVTVLQPLLQKPDIPPPPGSGPVEMLGELPELPSPPDFVANPPSWVVYSVDILLLLIPLTLAWLFWLRWQRNRRKGAPLELLAEEAQQALARLQGGHNLKDTIMRCYAEMSQTLQKERGVERQQAMTPREFELHLAQSGLRDEHIRQLTRLFENVRYGAKTPGQREEQEAVACLQAIVQAYGKAA